MAEFTAPEIATKLRLSLRTLETILGSDLRRSIDDKRFQFHVRRGRKRFWSDEDFECLKRAVERESAPGGVLAGSSSRTVMASGTYTGPCGPQDVQSACAEVLAFPLTPITRKKPRRSSMSSVKTSKLKQQDSSAKVTPLRSQPGHT